MALSRRSFLSAAGLAAGGSLVPRGAASAAATPASRVVPVSRARSVFDFVDSVGVNAHWGYLDTPYGNDYSSVRELLRASGIRHVRTWETHRIDDLFTSGIRTTALIDIGTDGSGDPASQVRALAPQAAAGALAGLEGPNEVDISWTDGTRRYQGRGFPDGPLLWQRALFTAAKADPRLRGVPVLGMTFGKNYWNGGMPYAPGTLAGTSDWGNFHPYPGGNGNAPQYTYGGIPRYYSSSDFPSVAIDAYPVNLTTYSAPFGTLPMAASETGYSTWKYGESERTQGRYLPRMFMENFRLGIVRTFAYELLDLFAEPSGASRDWHFGMLRNDLSPKPSYTAVQSMFRALTGGSATAEVTDSDDVDLGAELRVLAADGYDPAALHHVTLKRGDGTVVLVVWHEVSSNDASPSWSTPRGPMRELDHPAVLVSLDVDRSTRGMSASYIDDAGALRAKALARSGTAATFLVGDRLTFVTIPPA